MALATTRFLPVLDCPDPRALADFYHRLLGWPVTDDGDDWVELARDETTGLAFQRAPEFTPKHWPAEGVYAHIDFHVSDLDEGERFVLELGALRVDNATAASEPPTFRVYRDPAGHHFCLCVA